MEKYTYIQSNYVIIPNKILFLTLDQKTQIKKIVYLTFSISSVYFMM